MPILNDLYNRLVSPDLFPINIGQIFFLEKSGIPNWHKTKN